MPFPGFIFVSISAENLSGVAKYILAAYINMHKFNYTTEVYHVMIHLVNRRLFRRCDTYAVERPAGI